MEGGDVRTKGKCKCRRHVWAALFVFGTEQNLTAAYLKSIGRFIWYEAKLDGSLSEEN
jgi:hypothetical protein